MRLPSTKSTSHHHGQTTRTGTEIFRPRVGLHHHRLPRIGSVPLESNLLTPSISVQNAISVSIQYLQRRLTGANSRCKSSSTPSRVESATHQHAYLQADLSKQSLPLETTFLQLRREVILPTHQYSKQFQHSRRSTSKLAYKERAHYRMRIESER